MTTQQKTETYIREHFIVNGEKPLLDEKEYWSDAGMSWTELPPLHLQHFFEVLEGLKSSLEIMFSDSTIWVRVIGGNYFEINFSLQTGQPNTPDDWSKLARLLDII